MQAAIPTIVMRGGTSKGLYFLGSDLPADTAERDRLLTAVMGSPDPRQIDGMGGGHPLTSKVAIVSESPDPGADIDYLFLQVAVDSVQIADGQNCGNILAGVGQFAIERGLIEPDATETRVRVRMINSDSIATVTVQTPNRQVTYQGNTSIDGVAGTAAPVIIDFTDVAGTNCGALLPTGNVVDELDGVAVTCIDNGMPVVVIPASAFGKTGYESPSELENDEDLKKRIESIRRQAGPLMKLGDVTGKTVPKVSLVAEPRNGGGISTRTFIPHRVHQSIGVLGAASVAAACRIPGSVAAGLATAGDTSTFDVEHPGGSMAVNVELATTADEITVVRSALVRTARKLMEGTVFAPDGVAASGAHDN